MTADRGRAGPRSYLADGTRITWQVEAPDGWRVAVDAEHADQVLPPHVRARSGLAEDESGERALAGWTQAEVMAKITDTPILLRLRTFGLGLADLGEYVPIALMTYAHEGIIATVGARWADCQKPVDAVRSPRARRLALPEP